MKIPTYLAQGDIPGGFSSRALAVPTAPAMPVVANPLGAGLVASGDAIARAGAAIDAAEAEKRKYQDAADTTAAVTSADDQIAQMEITLKTGRRDPDTGEVIEAPATHKDYFQRWQEGRNAIVQQTLEAMPDATTKMQAAGLINRALIPKQVAARGYANELFKNQLEAQTEQTLSSAANKAVDDPFYESLGLAEAEKMRGFWPGDKIASVQQKFQETVATARLDKAFQSDPEGTIAVLREGKTILPPDTSQRLADRYTQRLDSALTHREAEQKRAQVEIDKQQTAAYYASASDLYALALEGKATPLMLEDWRQANRGRPIDTEYDRIRKAMDPKERPQPKSDPATQARVFADAESSSPKMRSSDLIALNEAGLLDNADLKYALGQLRQTDRHNVSEGRAAETQQQARENQRQTKAMKEHAQAEQELRAAILGPESLTSQITKEQERVYAQGLRYLRTRSSAYGGDQPPLEALDAMLPTFRQKAGRVTQATQAEIAAQLAYPDKASLEAARNRIPDGFYRLQRELLQQKEAADAEAKRLADEAAAARNAQRPAAPKDTRPPREPGGATP